jgi:subtilisin family serine protease
MSRLVRTVALFAIVVAGLSWASATRAQNSTDVYIVRLRGNPVVAYGGELGMPATKPEKGRKIDPADAKVRQYVEYLTSVQDSIVAAVGAEKVYNYRYTFNGFAARMTADQAAALEGMPEVVRVWKDELLQPQTDSTPAFLGLSGRDGVWNTEGLLGENVVVGMIDTGIWPEHPSFADTGCDDDTPGGRPWPWGGWHNKHRRCGPYRYDPSVRPRQLDAEQRKAARYGAPPESFTASGCDFGNGSFNPADAPFECNGKLVAARYYAGGFSTPGTTNPDGSGGDGAGLIPSEYLSARDQDGHGSHTSSTAAGNLYVPASIEGEYLGRVSGMAPRARIATYKVCWNGTTPPAGYEHGCYSSDSMAAIDQAVADGVDVINFSIGGSGTNFNGPDDIAFLFAADAGVFVATSNGNTGPGAQTVGTPAGEPWVTAVGASQDDQVFALGLKVTAPSGVAGIYEGLEGAGPVTIADAGPISGALVPAAPANGCSPFTNGAAVSGNIALVIRGVCGFVNKYLNAQAAGATAIVVYNDGTAPDRYDPIVMGGLTDAVTIPGMMIGFTDGSTLAGTAGVMATLSADVLISKKDTVAGFSSRGPNGGAPDVIKPDVVAPGVNILAAQTPTPNDGQTPGQLFQIISGTSMASPHVAGVGALLRQEHPDWTPAMVRSALMTTARQNLKKTFGDTPADPFDIGAGQIVPADAVDPGLVYDAGLLDYVAFTCGAEGQPPIFTPGSCAYVESLGYSTDSSDLNLPSIAVASLAGEQTVRRTVTAVARGRTTWRARVEAPPGIKVTVHPSYLSLGEGETATYEVTFKTDGAPPEKWAFGSLTWVTSRKGSHHEHHHCVGHDGRMKVRSPLAVRPVKLAAAKELAGSASNGSGSLQYEITLGYNGPFSAVPAGLVPAEVQAGAVATGSYDVHIVDVPADTRYARFSLFNSDVGDGSGSDDLDLQVQGPDTAGYPLVGTSGSSSSNEEVDVTNPAPGLYAVIVIHYASANDPTPYKLFSWSVGPDLGNMTVAAPTTASIGTAPITVSWTGLAPATRYLGGVYYRDDTGEIGSTLITVHTP